MCGISVIVALQGQTHQLNGSASGPLPNGVDTHFGKDPAHDDYAAKLSKELDESLKVIDHRGPDSRGQWISDCKRVAMGHNRLAINDLSPDGEQPFHDAENTVHAVVNGELYDHERIREDLVRESGYRFKGHSDSEIVIALYKHYGLSFLRYLRGEFALCLYDSRTHFFMAARDRYGIKPLHWTVVDGRLLIAAEAKAFLPLGWKPDWDVKSLLDGGWNHDERTLFDGVHKVRPGHYLTVASFGHIEQRQYWDVDYKDKHEVETRTEKEMIEGVREHMLDAIRLRLRADVPVGVYLSGGIDSSVIAGMIAHLAKEEGVSLGSGDPKDSISAFSIAFDEDSGFDESSIADRTAQWLGVKYIKKLMNEAELAKRFEDATWHAEHHNPDLNFVGKYALSEVPRENGFKVVLTGEGADENFGGYPLYLPDYLREPDHSMPNKDLTEDLRKKFCVEKEEEAADYYRKVGADASNRLENPASRQLNHITTVASMAAFSFNMFAPWTSCYGICDPRITIANNIDGRVKDMVMDKWHPLHTAEYVWTKGHLANIFLTCLGDRTEMAHSIEARTPFLDHKLTQYVNNLPPSMKIHYNAKDDYFTEKYILREASRPFITDELYKRKKHPYSAPTTWPEDGPLHKLMSKLVTRENVQQLGFVDWDGNDESNSANGTNGHSLYGAHTGGSKSNDEKKSKGGAKQLVHKAFVEKDPLSMRMTLLVAEWVVIAKRFGVKTAELPVWADPTRTPAAATHPYGNGIPN